MRIESVITCVAHRRIVFYLIASARSGIPTVEHISCARGSRKLSRRARTIWSALNNGRRADGTRTAIGIKRYRRHTQARAPTKRIRSDRRIRGGDRDRGQARATVESVVGDRRHGGRDRDGSDARVVAERRCVDRRHARGDGQCRERGIVRKGASADGGHGSRQGHAGEGISVLL